MHIVHQGHKQLFSQYAQDLLANILQVAQLLGDEYVASCQLQQHKIQDVSLTPSAQILAAMAAKKMSYHEFILAKTQQYHEYFARAVIDPQQQQHLDNLAAQSHQAALNITDTLGFDDFLARYISSYKAG